MVDQKVLVLVGMPGAGKSHSADYVEHKGYPSVYFGGITLDELKQRGLEITPENEQMVLTGIRSDEGPGAYAHRIIKQIEDLFSQGNDRIVVDGVYSWTEYKIFSQHFGDKVTFVAIVAPRHIRHSRLATRPVRPLTKEQVNARDHAEIENIEKGGPIANADYTVLNDSTPEHLLENLERVLKEIGF